MPREEGEGGETTWVKQAPIKTWCNGITVEHLLGEVLDVKGCGLPRNHLMTTKSIAAEREREREHTGYNNVYQISSKCVQVYIYCWGWFWFRNQDYSLVPRSPFNTESLRTRLPRLVQTNTLLSSHTPSFRMETDESQECERLKRRLSNGAMCYILRWADGSYGYMYTVAATDKCTLAGRLPIHSCLQCRQNVWSSSYLDWPGKKSQRALTSRRMSLHG